MIVTTVTMVTTTSKSGREILQTTGKAEVGFCFHFHADLDVDLSMVPPFGKNVVAAGVREGNIELSVGSLHKHVSTDDVVIPQRRVIR